MVQSEPNGLFAMVELNYQCVFTFNLFFYTGGVKNMLKDVDFSSMTYSKCVTFFERFMHEDCKKLYYCEPDVCLMEGLNPISDDVEYATFIFDAYETNCIIYVYVDHIGVGVDGWFNDEDNDDDGHEYCIDGENEDNIDELRNVELEFNEDVVHMNRTSNDHFLSKLCVDEEDDSNIVNDDDGRVVYVEHIQCARHIFQNLSKRFTGAIYHTVFWITSKATTENAFEVVVEEIMTRNPNSHQYLMEKDPKTWSRAFFQPGRCCDVVENRFFESFNVVIVDARKKPIITMLEELRIHDG
ncbi:unnamed protein product [Lactuca saligna]|uniref:Uncharacterized protein n=2 Tax=Lactuca saligna TaxID=75948 RepID=A0AA36E7K0_LACSI|nr:unnamed protein product [Lactuca saligna]